ncbi:hypothetical protein RYA05_01030 [Pseudomonas syringae pv. actinidiae]|nr:hypothetical protein [Pseudomonas syringae pv. actinidiae]
MPSTINDYRMQSPMLDTFIRVAEEAGQDDWLPNVQLLIEKNVSPAKIDEDFSKLYSIVIMRRLEKYQQLTADGFHMMIPEGAVEANLVATLRLERLECRKGVLVNGSMRVHGKTEVKVCVRPNGAVVFSIPSLEYVEDEVRADTPAAEELIVGVVHASWKEKNYDPFRRIGIDSFAPKS